MARTLAVPRTFHIGETTSRPVRLAAILQGVTRIAILGPGAVGGLLAALLRTAGEDVLLVGRDRVGPALDLAVSSPRYGELDVTVPAAAAVDGSPDVLVVAVKAPALDAALERVRGAPAAVVPLLNGVEHVGRLRERFGDRVVAATVRVQAHRDAPGRIVHRAPFLEVAVAAPGVAALEVALRDARVDVTSGVPEADVLWGKLCRLAALGLATAAADAPLGEVRDDARAAAREVVAVARAEGAELHEEAVLGELDGLPHDASSSLRADIAAGVPSELDAIGGAVLRAAARHGLAAPTVERLAATVHRRTVA